MKRACGLPRRDAGGEESGARGIAASATGGTDAPLGPGMAGAPGARSAGFTPRAGRVLVAGACAAG